MKRKIPLIIFIAFFILSMSIAPHVHGYSSEIRAHRTILWELDVVPNDPFLMYYTEGGYWLAENETYIEFEVSSINDDIVGMLSLGNVSISANDTEIAKDLTLGVWGTYTEWWPGLIIEVSQTAITELNATAFASAERVAGNFLNGTMSSNYETITIGSDEHQCITFDFEQDPPGNQVTHLAYSLTTGVLIEANTSFTFATPYELAFRFAGFQDPVDLTPDPGIVITIVGVVGGALIAIVIFVFVRSRKS